MDPALALEAWQWLAGVHPMICASTTVAERLAKAETCLSSAVVWEERYANAKLRWASDELEELAMKLIGDY